MADDFGPPNPAHWSSLLEEVMRTLAALGIQGDSTGYNWPSGYDWPGGYSMFSFAHPKNSAYKVKIIDCSHHGPTLICSVDRREVFVSLREFDFKTFITTSP